MSWNTDVVSSIAAETEEVALLWFELVWEEGGGRCYEEMRRAYGGRK